MARWEASWEVELAASSPEELLTALLVRDLLHGSSFDVEVEGADLELEVDFVAGDELEDESYRLLLVAEVEGGENREAVHEFAEQIFDELFAEAESMVAERAELAAEPLEALEFRPVGEDEERWDLVVPDWLAPDGAEVPFGFRPFLRSSDEVWPPDLVIDRHGRVVLVPFGDTARLYGVPAPSEEPD